MVTEKQGEGKKEENLNVFKKADHAYRFKMSILPMTWWPIISGRLFCLCAHQGTKLRILFFNIDGRWHFLKSWGKL